ncbi:hypothetical protein AAFN60_18115 [Roseibacillus persicicus]|uniref:hypothetical protein n=1 Tax=Roseibacillus persicicus TaxID=454148 RepID=UPI00398ACBC1
MSEESLVQKLSLVEEPALFRKAALYCAAVSGICVTHAILALPDILGAAAWILGGVYFYTAPEAMRQGDEKRRMMVGVLAVILVLISLGGLLSFQRELGRVYGFVSLVALFFAIPTIRFFGYNQDIVSFVAQSRSERHRNQGESSSK